MGMYTAAQLRAPVPSSTSCLIRMVLPSPSPHHNDNNICGAVEIEFICVIFLAPKYDTEIDTIDLDLCQESWRSKFSAL